MGYFVMKSLDLKIFSAYLHVCLSLFSILSFSISSVSVLSVHLCNCSPTSHFSGCIPSVSSSRLPILLILFVSSLTLFSS